MVVICTYFRCCCCYSGVALWSMCVSAKPKNSCSVQGNKFFLNNTRYLSTHTHTLKIAYHYHTYTQYMTKNAKTTGHNEKTTRKNATLIKREWSRHFYSIEKHNYVGVCRFCCVCVFPLSFHFSVVEARKSLENLV